MRVCVCADEHQREVRIHEFTPKTHTSVCICARASGRAADQSRGALSAVCQRGRGRDRAGVSRRRGARRSGRRRRSGGVRQRRPAGGVYGGVCCARGVYVCECVCVCVRACVRVWAMTAVHPCPAGAVRDTGGHLLVSLLRALLWPSGRHGTARTAAAPSPERRAHAHGWLSHPPVTRSSPAPRRPARAGRLMVPSYLVLR